MPGVAGSDPWADWRFEVAALAAGVSPLEFGRLTRSQTVRAIAAYEERRFWVAQHHVSASMANMSDEACGDVLAEKPGNPLRGQAYQKMLESFIPRHWKAGGASAPIIPGLTPRAAEGIVRAVEQGLLSLQGWTTILPVYERIVATAERFKSS